MLLGLLARMTKVHLAATEAEREAIFRFRYAIYGRELRRDYPGIEHQRGRLHQDEDDLPETRLYYTGSPSEMTGTARARVWDKAPPAIVEELSLQRMPQVKLAYLERTMVRPTLRGRLGMPSILWHGYEHLMTEGVEACVLTCVPGLARHYLRLGARTYGAALVEGASSAEVPLLILMNDVEHLRRAGSFMLPQVRRLARPFDPAPFAPLFEGPQPLSFETPALDGLKLFEGLSARALQWIARNAYVLEVPAGGLVVRKGTAEREMYVVLEGALEVSPGAARIGKGEAMGEVGFLGTPGVRTATVRAVTKSRLLVLRRKLLDGLAERDPRAAYQLSRNLARLVADRFAELRASVE
ncbi:MAG: cyclic nucleotide-binding domain-containing protein [Myxococcales bacterium]